jgi:signal transduction histidine kinase
VIRAVEPGSVAKRAMGRVTPAAQARQVTLSLEVAPGLPPCETDASRVEQILGNLLANGIQHTRDASSVRLLVGVEGDRIVFTVRDEGPGIPPEEVERIFDVYTSKKEGDVRGMGLGLPLSRRLARLLGGDLRAVAHPGAGGEFVLELPAVSPA